MDIILASSSPRRREILEKNGYKFKILSEEIDEKFDNFLNINENLLCVSYKKVINIASKNRESICIGCDTIVVLNDQVFGKPKSEEDAFKMLRMLSGNTHKVMSGIAILYKDIVENFVVTSKVTFKELKDEEILSYISTKECFGKAGSYAIQGIGSTLIERYEGELENIIGLPILEVKRVLDGILK